MEVIRVEDKAALSQKAAEWIIAKVKEQPAAVLGLATGSTPIGAYEKMVEDYQQGATSYQQVTTANLDEYIGLAGDHPQSYRYFMDDQLFSHIDIQTEQTHIPDGTADDMTAEAQRYDDMIAELGGIDLQLLGIGENGHIGFNEPGTSFTTGTHIVTLADSTRQANARFFDSIAEVPREAITMGIQTILQSKEIILLASGEKKAKAVQQLLQGEKSEAFPASALQDHHRVTVIADEAALSLS